jgi:hypothetical protein
MNTRSSHLSLVLAGVAGLVIALRGGTLSAQPAPKAFTDRDEGSMGPLQDAHEGEVVFSSSIIEKKAQTATLVTETTLDRPLFVRAYLAQTPARTFHDNKQECPWETRRLLKFYAKLQGAESGVYLYTMPLGDKTFDITRSKTITEFSANGAIVSIVPTARFEMNGGENPAISPFVELAAGMKPGANVVDVELQVGCEGQPGADGNEFAVVSKGQITFQIKGRDLSAFAKRVGPSVRPSIDDAAAKRIKPSYAKALGKKVKILSFAADRTEVDPTVQKSTDLRAVLRNVDKTCSYVTGKWIEPYAGAGTYGPGHIEGGGDVALPCP